VLLATTLRDCAFFNCQSSSSGGDLCSEKETISLGLTGYIFMSCRTVGHRGGAICAQIVEEDDSHGCQSFPMNQTTGRNCSSVQHDSFYAVCVAFSAINCIEIRDSSSVCGSANIGGALELMCMSYMACRTTWIDSLKSSANHVSEPGSAFFIWWHFNLSLRFCTFSANSSESAWFESSISRSLASDVQTHIIYLMCHTALTLLIFIAFCVLNSIISYDQSKRVIKIGAFDHRLGFVASQNFHSIRIVVLLHV
jgi:hypothetical protein